MFRNESVCCVCQKKNVQIHHIDGNSANNKPNNLAVLCIEDHDRASSRSSMTRGLTPALVRRFKADWEKRVSQKRRLIRRGVAGIKEEPFIKFEIKRLVFALPAFKDKKTTNSIIEQLYNWHVFTDYTPNIFKSLDSIRWFLSASQIAILLDRIYEFFWHLVGPEEVPMRNNDKKNLLLAIELIGDLGIQTIILGENLGTLARLFYPADRFTEIAKWYKQPALTRALRAQLVEIKKELMTAKGYPRKSSLVRKLDERIRAS